MSACIRVSGTYFPPNFPNRPNESGLCNRVEDPLSSIRSSGSRVGERVQEIAREENEWLERVNLWKAKGNLSLEGLRR